MIENRFFTKVYLHFEIPLFFPYVSPHRKGFDSLQFGLILISQFLSYSSFYAYKLVCVYKLLYKNKNYNIKNIVWTVVLLNAVMYNI